MGESNNLVIRVFCNFVELYHSTSMPQTIITTERLKLRHWAEADIEPFIKMNKDPEVMRFFPAAQSDEETRQQLTRIKQHFADHGYGLYAAERSDTGAFIGYIGFAHPRFNSFFTPCVEIGWRLSKENWGLGFATEAARACIQHGFDILHFPEIYSFTATINLPSVNVMKRSGLTYTGKFNHPSLPTGHPLEEHVLYRIAP